MGPARLGTITTLGLTNEQLAGSNGPNARKHWGSGPAPPHLSSREPLRRVRWAADARGQSRSSRCHARSHLLQQGHPDGGKRHSAAGLGRSDQRGSERGRATGSAHNATIGPELPKGGVVRRHPTVTACTEAPLWRLELLSERDQTGSDARPCCRRARSRKCATKRIGRNRWGVSHQTFAAVCEQAARDRSRAAADRNRAAQDRERAARDREEAKARTGGHSFSAGLAALEDGDDPAALIARADHALRRARQDA